MNDSFILDSKQALPNKLIQDDGSVTDITGKDVVIAVEAYENKPALPNKFLNPDGSYSTLNEIIAEMVDTSVFIIVEELPEVGREDKIYLISDGKGGFYEYHYHDGKWDPVGVLKIDLSNYSTTEEMILAITEAATQCLKDAQEYADNKATDVLNSAKQYTDEAIKTNITTVLGGEF